MTLPVYFCFSIYGHEDRYWRGLLENIHLINAQLPDAKIILLYHQVPTQFLSTALQQKGILLWKIPEHATQYRMIQRLLITDRFEQGAFFIRDADSRVTERDVHCIKAFLQSDKQYHTIRDHFYHKSRIMGGTFGFKKLTGFQPIVFTDLFAQWLAHRTNRTEYGLDEYFLRDIVFPAIQGSLLIHTNSVAHTSELTMPMGCALKDNHDFIGNVYDWNGAGFTPRFGYWQYMTSQHMQWLQSQQQYDVLIRIGLEYEIRQIEWKQRADMLNIFLDACLRMHAAAEGCQILGKYRHALIDDGLIARSNLILQMLRAGRQLVASFDCERVAGPNEVVVVYGEYSHDVRYLPTRTDSCTIYRHPVYFTGLVHDKVEYDPVWEPIQQIYILNLEERRDRYMHQLVELCRVQAPLHRIYHYKARKESITGDRLRDAYIGATQNHLDAVEHFLQNAYSQCLVLEDDFLFNMNYKKLKGQLATFFQRAYDYDICFIGYSKQGELQDCDDLLSYSCQPCTTSSAYFLRRETAHKIYECLKTGVEQMRQGGDPGIYCCDRYWAKLQPARKFFVFREKLGYQRITHSDIVARVNYNFD